MFKNEYQVVPWAMRSSATSKWGTSKAIMDAMNYNELYMWISKGSSFPYYEDKGPDLNVTITLPAYQLSGYGPYPAIKCTSFSLDWGKNCTTAQAYCIDITKYALGAIAIKADLIKGAGSPLNTARATYGITVFGRGYT